MINKEDVLQAYENIRKSIIRTPLVESIFLSQRYNSKIYLKLENLQRTGSFKIRGATNTIINLSDENKKRGVIANSAGNHAQGVALAATLNNIKSTIVMPNTAPYAKVLATKNYGARVVQYGDTFDEAFIKAKEIQEENDLYFLHAFNDDLVIAGQATIGIEILEDLENVDTIVIPVGGGGLIAGIGMYVKSINPNIKIIGIEPKEAASMKQALEIGQPVFVPGEQTIADGTAVRKVGDITYEMTKRYVDKIYTVTDESIVKAMLLLAEKSKVIAEGSGASSVAALLEEVIDKEYIENKNVCFIISGGNLDINQFEKYISYAQILDKRRLELDLIIPDKIGSLNQVTEIIKKHKANILYISQTHYDRTLKINEQKLEVVIECHNSETAKEILKELKEKSIRLGRGFNDIEI